MSRPTVLPSLLLPVVLAACNNARPAPVTPAAPRVDAPVAPPVVTPTARFAADVVARIPHAPDAFTQGLAFYEGSLFESTGLYGRTTGRVLDPAPGSESRRRDVAPEHFAEGLTVFGRRIYQLTYETHRCFVYDAATLEPVAEHTYTGEGWGLTHDDRSLIMSDGTDTPPGLATRPRSFRTRSTIITCSARSFTEWRRPSYSPGAAVPLMGSLHAVRPSLATMRSGDADTTVPSSITT
jgi:glutamine cyclotransferase